MWQYVWKVFVSSLITMGFFLVDVCPMVSNEFCIGSSSIHLSSLHSSLISSNYYLMYC